jgi:chromosome segregation ATPase
VQYLAELRKTQSFVGSKIEVKLIARNTSDNNWQGINNDEIVAVTDGNQVNKDLKDGQMVLVEIGNNKNIQSVQDASKRLVLLLQNFSRLQEKFKQGEEDIEQWKQSLNYQSQELHRREMELEQKEQEIDQIDNKRQEVETAQGVLRKEREEFEKWRKQFEIQQQNVAAQANSLSDEQAEYLKSLAIDITACLSNTDYLHQTLNSSLETIHQRQEILTGFWQQLETLRHQAGQQQGNLNSPIQDLNYRKTQLQQVQANLIDSQAALKADEEVLKIQEATVVILRSQINAQTELSEQLGAVIESYGGNVGEFMDPEEAKRLEELPIDQLESAINKWQSEFDNLAKYVEAQEDELAALEGEIADFQSQIDQANEFDRIELESSKEFSEEQYKLLEDALSGQRKTMLERQGILTQQRTILDRRQGMDIPDNPVQNLLPVLAAIESQKSILEAELRKLTGEIDGTRIVVRQRQDAFNRLSDDYQRQNQEQGAMETELREKFRVTGELVGQVNTQEQILRPVQDVMDILRQQLESATTELNQSPQNPQQLIADLQYTLDHLIPQ